MAEKAQLYKLLYLYLPIIVCTTQIYTIHYLTISKLTSANEVEHDLNPARLVNFTIWHEINNFLRPLFLITGL